MGKVTVGFIMAGVFLAIAPGHAKSQDIDAADKAMEFLKAACGSDDELEIVADGEGGLALFRKGKLGALEGRASFKMTELRGVASDLQDELKVEESRDIRDCMEKRIDRILNAVLETSEPNRQTVDYDEFGLTLEYAAVSGDKDQVVAEFALKNNTDAVKHVQVHKNETKMIIRREAFERYIQIQGISNCKNRLDYCGGLDAGDWTMLQPRDVVYFKIYTTGTSKKILGAEMAVNIRMLSRNDRDFNFRDFSFRNVKIE